MMKMMTVIICYVHQRRTHMQNNNVSCDTKTRMGGKKQNKTEEAGLGKPEN